MKIQRLYTKNSLRNYDYILTTSSNEVIVIDPSSSLLERELEKVDYYFITHEHEDHIVGLGHLQKTYGGLVVAPCELVSSMDIDRPVGDGDTISFTHESFRILAIPGHTMSHIGFILSEGGKESCAFLGDTVFNGGVGNTISGDCHVLCQTIFNKILSLPPSLVLYPEHDYWETNLRFTLSIEPDNKKARELLQKYQASNYLQTGMFPPASLGDEREYNLFFRTHLPSVQEEVRRRLELPKDCSRQAIFTGLRELRDQW